MEDLKDKNTYISHYVQSTRTFTKDKLDELKELIERMKQEPPMFFAASLEDMVKVVRCKDCKYRPYLPKECDPDESDGFDLVFPYEGKCPCECEDGWYSYIPEDDWFCANGKRKESE